MPVSQLGPGARVKSKPNGVKLTFFFDSANNDARGNFPPIIDGWLERDLPMNDGQVLPVSVRQLEIFLIWIKYSGDSAMLSNVCQSGDAVSRRPDWVVFLFAPSHHIFDIQCS